MFHFVYILKCVDKTYYTGYSVDIIKRVKTHNSGIGAKYTRSRLPVELVYWKEFPTKSEAMSEEYRIKQLTRKQKKELIYAMHGARL